ncbi:unnamed protein product [Diabrotica balteata]|uniref:Uncharacterized protein n=1 Tax=Diabrotica balteata TaxID=107213 RepID=A0A9N9T816_DIABA|nr:unnamed protein product [Diabrotica balteata]
MKGKKYNEVLSEMRENRHWKDRGTSRQAKKKTNGGDLLVKLNGRGAAEKLRAELDTGQNERDGHGNPKKGDFLHDYESGPWGE